MQHSTLLRYFAILLALFLGVAFLWLVWPTRYRYDRLKSETNEMPVRIDRLTGRVEVLSGSGWRPLGSSESKKASQKEKEEKEEELPPFELARLEGRCSIDSVGWINCDIYNGSSWTVNEITIAITVSGGKRVQEWDEKGNPVADRPDFIPLVLSRKYKLVRRSYESGAPLESTEFHAALGFSVTAPQSWAWEIAGAQGIRGTAP